MRASLLSWWQAVPHSDAAAPSPAATGHAADFLFALPAPAYLEPPTLAEALAAGSARPTLADIAPLVETARQCLLACVFRSSMYTSAERVTSLIAAIKADASCGGPLAWRKLVEAHCLQDSAADVEVVDKEKLVRRIDASLTSMFGSITKGCGAVDGDAGSFACYADSQKIVSFMTARSHRPEGTSAPSSLRTGALRHDVEPIAGSARQALCLFRPGPQDAAPLWPIRREGFAEPLTDLRRCQRGLRADTRNARAEGTAE